jgi:hypothetical protein
MNFASESACLMADNFYGQIPGDVENAVPLHVDIFRNCFVKNTGTTVFHALSSTPDTNFHWMEQDFMG